MLSNGDETKAQQAVTAVATSNPGADPNGGGLQPAGGIQMGDLGMFPTGVDLTFGASPDVSKVKWVNPGDPANGYIPDITSPTAGPGHTQGTDKTGDPTGTIPEIQLLATDEDPSDQGTADPSTDGPAIYKNNAIGRLRRLAPQAHLAEARTPPCLGGGYLSLRFLEKACLSSCSKKR